MLKIVMLTKDGWNRSKIVKKKEAIVDSQIKEKWQKLGGSKKDNHNREKVWKYECKMTKDRRIKDADNSVRVVLARVQWV